LHTEERDGLRTGLRTGLRDTSHERLHENLHEESHEGYHMASIKELREHMVEHQLKGRGIKDARVLAAMGEVPRERFVPSRHHDLSYDDSPLPIEEGQTISQPYIVALMLEAAEIGANDRVLEVGVGSGYVTALISRLANEVYGIEWHEALASLAKARLEALECANARVMRGDGTLGWPDRAPFNAIVVSAGGPDVPAPLLAQLAIGGRLVIPVGTEPRLQELMVITRTGDHAYDRRSLGSVQFVPLVGSEGWSLDHAHLEPHRARRPIRIGAREERRLEQLVAEGCEPFDTITHAPLEPLLDRIGTARVVLIGESTHGTADFYRMRARITEALVARKGFNIVALEADWPDTASLDQQVRGRPVTPLRDPPFSRFPTWMWRNREVSAFIDWLRRRNGALADPAQQASVHGLDIYSLNNSIGAVLEYLDRIDPIASERARELYSCFTPWERDPTTYGRAVTAGRLAGCEKEALGALKTLLEERLRYSKTDGDRFFDAARNATVVSEAERYYRAMFRGARESWNMRDRHMYETLLALLEHRGPDSRAVVWAHNSHVGNATATEMSMQGELNLGQLVREKFGERAYAIGFGTDHGTVAAASNWDGAVEVKEVRPSHPDSYEHVFHGSGNAKFFLPLRKPHSLGMRTALLEPRLQRAIGVIYRPDTELVSHYFQATLPMQFDEWIWIDETSAVVPAGVVESQLAGAPETYPFGL
jgi:protein-L-isoaspartate(D-aspartate) O-methyltransferase